VATPTFPRWATPVARISLAVLLFVPVAVPGLMMAWVRTGWSTGEGRAPVQPVDFDHRLHAGDFRIDCRYCHATAETGASAGVPPSEICVPCHDSAWLNGPKFAQVRRSLATDRPIPWRRVNLLPDFVYFDHAAHTRHGIGCVSCHGRVDRMARVAQAAPLTMGWCLDCHQHPQRHLRPRREVTNMRWQPPASAAEAAALRRELARRYHVESPTSCVTCHR